MTEFEQLRRNTEKAYQAALNALFDLVNAITEERNYYRELCEQKEYKKPSATKYQIGDIVGHSNNTDLRYMVQAIYKDGTYRIVPLNANMGEAISSATEECMTLIERNPMKTSPL